MRPCLLVSLIVFSMFISEIHGIRLNKEFLSSDRHKIQEVDLVQTNDKPAVEAIKCKHEDCSGSTSFYKLTVKETPKPTTTIITISKLNERTAKIIGGKEESFPVDSRPVFEHPGAPTDRTSDILDLAGMDYSPAKRKPPIHN